MKGKIAVTFLSTLMLFGALSTPFSAKNPAKAANSEEIQYIINEDFESFEIEEPGVLNSGWNPDSYGWQAFSGAGESKGRIVSDGVDPYLELRYDGVSSATNANAVLWNTNIGKGLGAYTLSFDFKCYGLSQGDNFLWTLYGPDYYIDGVKKYCNTGDISILQNQATYNTYPDSTTKVGWKKFTTTYVCVDANWTFDTLRFNLYLHENKNPNIIVQIDNLSIKKDGNELITKDGAYYGDFSPYLVLENKGFLPSDGVQAKNKYNGFGSLFGESPAEIITESNGNKALKFAYTPGKSNYSSIFAFGEFHNAGLYTIEFDVKYTLDAKAYDFGFLLQGPNPWANPAAKKIATNYRELENFDDSTTPGCKRIKASIWCDNYNAKNVDSIALFYNTGGNINDYIIVDNLIVYLETPLNYITVDKTTVGNVSTPMLLLGDFDSMPLETVFSTVPTKETSYWHSIILDSPAVVKGDESNQYIELRYDGTPSHNYSSVFHPIECTQLFVDTPYCLSFDYQQNFVSGNTIDSRWHLSFTGDNGQETYKTYLNIDPSLGFMSDENRYTNGLNQNSYSFTVEEKDNGWYHFEMYFYIDYDFMKNANALRFVYDTEKNVENYIRLDNVDLRVFKETPLPISPFDSGVIRDNTNTFNYLYIIIPCAAVVAIALAVLTVVIIRRKRVHEN